ncbi:Serine/threonine-protein kinase WNK (With No Lysine)-related [Euphorbia peplus]|nr:Serine/threonine-protein kinase WNK (With No Lysine)-related [Euphorbia peplus]
MEVVCSGLPMLNCLLQHTLRSLCTTTDSTTSSKWVYAVFWRILPRNYPPPKWDYGGTALDRSKGNKRNWILVWEDGFCDFCECERAGSGYVKGRFGADVFFKMSHEVYNFGEGLLGKVAADNSHKWVFKVTPNEGDPNFNSSWNMSVEPQPKAWEFQFNSGIETIAIISVKEGIIQLGSFDKVAEDLNLVINIQRKFGYLQSIPGVFSMQRPYLPIQNHHILKPDTAFSVDDKCQLTGVKRFYDERLDNSAVKSPSFGWNSPQNGIRAPPLWGIPPLLPTMSCSLGALLSKLPAVIPSYGGIEALDTSLINLTSQRARLDGSSLLSEGGLANTKVNSACQLGTVHEEKPLIHN